MRGKGTLRRAIAGALAAAAICAGCEQSGRTERLPGRAEDYRARAEALEAEDAVAGALDAYRDAARRFPTQAWPWSGVGRASARLGRFPEAVEAFETAVRWDSTLVREREAVAEIALADGRAEIALARIGEAERLDGETPARWAMRARALAEAGRGAEARHAVERALTLAPDDPAVRAAGAWCLFRADSTTKALAVLDELVLIYPSDPHAHSARARVRRALGDRAAAMDDLRTALELSPRRPRDRLSLARWKLEAFDPEAAREHFRVLLQDNPRHAAALEGLGSCALATGDPEAAEEAFRRAIDSDPEFAPAYLALGRFRLEQRKLDESVTFFRKARARAGADLALWEACSAALADAYLELGESQNALDVAEAILARAPDSERARVLRGRALAAGKPGSGSGERLERIANQAQAMREEILIYAGWLLDHGDPGEALRFVERALSEHPGDAEVRVMRGRALGVAGRPEEAEAELHDLLREGLRPAETHLALARLYLRTGRAPDAAFHAREGESLRPGDPDFAVVRGLAAMGTGEPAEAVGAFRRARELEPEAWLPSYHLGQALAADGRAAEAVEAYRAVLARDERVAEAHNNLAWLLADLDLDPVLAEVHARRAAELAPANASVLGTLGWAQYKNRLLDEAAVSLKEAKRLAPEDAMKRYMLGVVELTRGKTDAGRLEIEEALRLDPAFERSEDARALLAGLD